MGGPRARADCGTVTSACKGFRRSQPADTSRQTSDRTSAGRINGQAALAETAKRIPRVRIGSADALPISIPLRHPCVGGNRVPLPSHISRLLTVGSPHCLSVVRTSALCHDVGDPSSQHGITAIVHHVSLASREIRKNALICIRRGLCNRRRSPSEPPNRNGADWEVCPACVYMASSDGRLHYRLSRLLSHPIKPVPIAAKTTAPGAGTGVGSGGSGGGGSWTVQSHL